MFEVPFPVESIVQPDCQAGSQEQVFPSAKGMSRGVITRVVRSFGSTWGLVRAAEAEHDSFFNLQSMLNKADFANLRVGQEVEFDEEAYQPNGTRVLRLRIVWVEPYGDFLDRSKAGNKGAEGTSGPSLLPGVQG